MKRLKITVYCNKEIVTLSAFGGKRLKELLFDAGILPALPCGGMGKCGKCAVKFLSGAPEPGSSDRTFFSEKELDEGKRLLCRCVLDRDCEISLQAGNGEEHIKVETTGNAGEKAGVFVSGDCGIAIDIGTTTIAAALIVKNEDSVMVADTESGVNHQRKFGADVISRITASEDSFQKKNMESCVKEDISAIISRLLQRNPGADLKGICISGNTTMLHLLRGYDLSGLGVYPYTPQSTEMEIIKVGDLLGEGFEISKTLLETEVVIMPGISAFVGADIVAGIYATDLFCERGKKKLLIDLGTNGEMAFFDGEKTICTSTAAGPAFEGGGISCGVPSVPGAINYVEIRKNGNSVISTIDNAPAIGICGSGLMQLVSELVRVGIVDSTGLLSEEFFENGYPVCAARGITITQKDIRNIQLAKAAIYAGAKELTGGEAADVIYLSGGFGNNIVADKIKHLGLFPRNWGDRIITSGNTSLEGGIRFLSEYLSGETRQNAAKEQLKAISGGAREVILSSMDNFDEEYIDAMNF